jgi:hypothetical protein
MANMPIMPTEELAYRIQTNGQGGAIRCESGRASAKAIQRRLASEKSAKLTIYKPSGVAVGTWTMNRGR